MIIRLSSFAAFLLALTATLATCQAQLVNVVWNGATGTQSWQNNANWSGGAFPNDSLAIADLSVNLGAGLSVDLGASGDITVAGVSIGSQSGAVASNIFSSGTARLVFRNEDTMVVTTGNDADFNNDTVVDGRDFLVWQRNFGLTGAINANDKGDANNDGNVNNVDLPIWQDQYGLGSDFQTPGNPYIETIGVSGATNTIAANIHARNEAIEIGGTKPLLITGNLTFEGDTTTGVSNAGLRVISTGLVATMNGTINLINSDADLAVDFRLNGDPQGQNQGTLIVNGDIFGAGKIQIGTGAILPSCL